MGKRLKKRSKDNLEYEDKADQMSKGDLKLMVEDLIKLINDNPKHKLFLNILNLFKNKEYSSLDFNEIYDYLLIDTKLNPLKYSSQDSNEENRPQLKSKLDLIMNKNCSFKVINRGRKKIIELNLQKAKEYLDKIINGDEVSMNEDKKKKKKENNTEESIKYDKFEDNEPKEKEEKKIDLKEDTKKEKEAKEDNKEENKEDKDEPIKKHRGRKKKIRRETKENLNLVINLNQKKEDIEKKRKKREKKEEKEEEKEKVKEKSKERKTSRKRKEKMEIEINDKFSITKKQEDDIPTNNIFLKPIYHEFFNQNANMDIIETLPQEINSSLEQIAKSKLEMNKLEEKMNLFNNKITDLRNNKMKYDDIKIKVKETQDELYNLYFIMINEVNSLKILKKMKNYNKEIYNIHEQALEKHKNTYTNTVDKIKIYLNDIKNLETDMFDSKKNLNQFLRDITVSYKNILGNINIHSINYENMELVELKYDEKTKEEDAIDVNSIINEFLKKKDEVLNKMEDNNSNESQEKKEKEENEEPNQKIEKKMEIKEEDIQKENEEVKGDDVKMEEEQNKIYYEDLNKIFEHFANNPSDETDKNNVNNVEQKGTFDI